MYVHELVKILNQDDNDDQFLFPNRQNYPLQRHNLIEKRQSFGFQFVFFYIKTNKNNA